MATCVQQTGLILIGECGGCILVIETLRSTIEGGLSQYVYG